MKISFKNNINFGTRQDTIAQSDKFIDDLLDENSRHKLNFENIKSHIKTTVPYVQVLKMNKISDKRKYLDGFFSAEVNPDDINTDFVLDDPKLVLNVPFFITSKAYNELLATSVHETTHALQNSDEEMSRVSIYKKYLPPDKPMIINTNLSAAKEFCIDIFNKFLLDIHSLFSGENRITSLLLATKLSNQENIFPKNTIQHLLDNVNLQYPNANMLFVKDLEYNMAIQEADAYSQEAKTKRKLHIPNRNSNLKAEVYSMLADTLSNIE